MWGIFSCFQPTFSILPVSKRLWKWQSGFFMRHTQLSTQYFMYSAYSSRNITSVDFLTHLREDRVAAGLFQKVTHRRKHKNPIHLLLFTVKIYCSLPDTYASHREYSWRIKFCAEQMHWDSHKYAVWFSTYWFMCWV